MQPLVRAALAVGALAVISGVAADRAGLRAPGGSAADAAPLGEGALARMPCGPRELPEGDACVPLPDAPPAGSAAAGDPLPPGAEEEPSPGARIPRRPDRPADVRALRLPIDGNPPLLDSTGAPLARTDVDLSVLWLGAERGTPIVAAPLADQVGGFEVLSVEILPGRGLTVVALATTEESKREQRWLASWASLDGAGPSVMRGAKLGVGSVVGFAGARTPGAGPGGGALRFEVRRLRAEVDPRATPLARLLGDAESIAIDVRNVLAPR